MPTQSLLQELFFQETMGRFVLGRVLAPTTLGADLEHFPGAGEVGRWQCDLTNLDALTWSNRVYEIFGLSPSAPVKREEAVAKYREHSRGVLESVRTYAIKHKLGFILDAEIDSPTEESLWIRVVAMPILENDQIIGLRGLKRVL